MSDETLISLTADIVSAHVSNNAVAVSDLPGLITTIYSTLAGVGVSQPEPVAKQEPAVSIRSSIKQDYIVCLEDGKKLKMLKRHLMTHYQMTPADYRTKWGLPSDYPMVAPSYAATRKSLALKIGLGRKPAAVPPAPAPIVPAAERPKAVRTPRAKRIAVVSTPSVELAKPTRKPRAKKVDPK